MKYIALLLTLFAIQAIAEDFDYYLVGIPAPISIQPETAAFDGKTFFNDSRILWNNAQEKAVGLVINFHKPENITRIEVLTSKPNEILWAPYKTEFFSWNSENLSWNSELSQPDGTGSATKKEYQNPLISTVWKPAQPVNSKAIKILMNGEHIWLCEVRIYAGEKLLKPEYAPVGPAAQTLLPDKEGVASGASSNPDTVWYLNGIDGKWLAVGQPNLLNRRDKVIFRFDITGYIPAGKVRKAVLQYEQVPFAARYRDELLVLDHFNIERARLSGNDLISNQVDAVRKYILERAVTNPIITRIDVTSQVNTDLSKGFGYSTFRVSSESAEVLGNPQNEATGVTINNGTMKLFIEAN